MSNFDLPQQCGLLLQLKTPNGEIVSIVWSFECRHARPLCRRPLILHQKLASLKHYHISERNMATKEVSVEDDPNLLTRRCSQLVFVHNSFLRKNLGLRVYKVDLVEELKPDSHPKHHWFGEQSPKKTNPQGLTLCNCSHQRSDLKNMWFQ